MPGTKAGAKRAAETNKKRYGKDFYRNIGRIGGKKNPGTGGFACKVRGADGLTGPERASLVGAIGGSISRRGPVKNKTAKKPTKNVTKKVEEPEPEKKSFLKRLFGNK